MSLDDIRATDVYERAYWQVQAVLDAALGTEVEDGAGEGIAAEVQLLADQRDRLLAVAEAARRFTTCPLYGHFHHRMGGVTDYTEQRRIDCADDQCSNPACVKWVDCNHPSHALRAALAALGEQQS